MRQRVNWTGKRIGKLTVMSYSHHNGKRAVWLVRCDCGTEKLLTPASFYGGTVSCGCKRGFANGKSHTPLYKVWAAMKNRCYNENSQAYCSYGKRGVEVCPEWLQSFDCFYEWAINNGYRRGLELDKDIKGTGKMYSPDNCLWVTERENMMEMRTRLRAKRAPKKKKITRAMMEKAENNEEYKKTFFTF